MSNELQTKLDAILLDKNTNLLPENLKKDVTCLGITGTLESDNKSIITLPKFLIHTPEDSAAGFVYDGDNWCEQLNIPYSANTYVQSEILCICFEPSELTITYTGTGRVFYEEHLICSKLDTKLPIYSPLSPADDAFNYIEKILGKTSNYDTVTYQIPAGIHKIVVRGEGKVGTSYYDKSNYPNSNKFKIDNSDLVELEIKGVYSTTPDPLNFSIGDVILIENNGYTDLLICNNTDWITLPNMDRKESMQNMYNELYEEYLTSIASYSIEPLKHLQGKYFYTPADSSGSIVRYVYTPEGLLKLSGFYESNSFSQWYGYITNPENNERRLFDYLGDEYSVYNEQGNMFESINDLAVVVNGYLTTHLVKINGPIRVEYNDYDYEAQQDHWVTTELDNCFVTAYINKIYKVDDTQWSVHGTQTGTFSIFKSNGEELHSVRKVEVIE